MGRSPPKQRAPSSGNAPGARQTAARPASRVAPCRRAHSRGRYTWASTAGARETSGRAGRRDPRPDADGAGRRRVVGGDEVDPHRTAVAGPARARRVHRTGRADARDHARPRKARHPCARGDPPPEELAWLRFALRRLARGRLDAGARGAAARERRRRCGFAGRAARRAAAEDDRRRAARGRSDRRAPCAPVERAPVAARPSGCRRAVALDVARPRRARAEARPREPH